MARMSTCGRPRLDYDAAATREHGVVLYNESKQKYSLSMSITEKSIQDKLWGGWHLVESALEEHGLNYHLDSRRWIVKIKTARGTNNPNMIYKAKRLLELLATTNVSPCMAIDVMNGHRELYVIQIGNQEGGICASLGIKEEEFVQKWKCLFFSLQALTELTLCNIFLNKNTVAAVGISPIGLRLFRTVVESSFIENQCPATVIKKISNNLQRFLVMGDLEDPHAKHEEENDLSSFEDEYGMLRASCFCVRFHECQKNKLQESWPVVESSFRDFGISSTLNLVERLMTVSTTRMIQYSELIYKARDLIGALAAGVPVSMAMKILDGEYYDIIKIGYQNGGLCSKYGIKKEQFARQRRHLQRSLEDLATLSHGQLFLRGDTVFALAIATDKFDLIQKIVESCIVKNANPAALVKKHRKDKLNRKLDQLNRRMIYGLRLEDEDEL